MRHNVRAAKKQRSKYKAPSRFGWFKSPLFRIILGVGWLVLLLRVFAGRLQTLPRGWELVIGFACFAAAIVVLWQTLRRMFSLARPDGYDDDVPQRLDQGHALDADVAYYEDDSTSQGAARADYRRSRSS